MIFESSERFGFCVQLKAFLDYMAVFWNEIGKIWAQKTILQGIAKH